MTRFGFPDWLLYGVVLAGILVLSHAGREVADAPPAPALPPGEDALPLDPALPFNPVGVRRISSRAAIRSGVAFSTGEPGSWLTARSVVAGCAKPMLMVGEGRGVAAAVSGATDEALAVLTTRGGAPALTPTAPVALRIGARGFIPGFPQGQIGEATVRYLGVETLPALRRGAARRTVLAWAETGRTEGLTDQLGELAGAPVLDATGAVTGVIIGQAAQRGRLYSTLPAPVRRALGGAPAAPPGEPVTVDNYGRVADSLRRDLRVAQALCLPA
jgi:serine protease Do